MNFKRCIYPVYSTAISQREIVLMKIKNPLITKLKIWEIKTTIIYITNAKWFYHFSKILNYAAYSCLLFRRGGNAFLYFLQYE